MADDFDVIHGPLPEPAGGEALVASRALSSDSIGLICNTQNWSVTRPEADKSELMPGLSGSKFPVNWLDRLEGRLSNPMNFRKLTDGIRCEAPRKSEFSLYFPSYQEIRRRRVRSRLPQPPKIQKIIE